MGWSARPRICSGNDPHLIDDFSGTIEAGYGKGSKTLLNNSQAFTKTGGVTRMGKINYHLYDAKVAGLHYDLCIEGIKPELGKSFGLHIPRGEAKGRYAFTYTVQGMVVVRMLDRSVLEPKPDMQLKSRDFCRRWPSRRRTGS